MVIVLFRSRLAPEAGDDYHAMAEEMAERARSMPGFVALRSYRGEDEERLSLIWWEDEESMRAWREDARHRIAQRLGREKWYAWFDLEVTHRARGTTFRREG
jgi:heme-degrading monooxygenase HmoA